MLTYDSRYQDSRDGLRRVQASIAWLVADSTLSWDVVKHLIDALTQLAWVVTDIPPPQPPDGYHPDAPGVTLAELHHQLQRAITPDREAAENFNLAWAARAVQVAGRRHDAEQQAAGAP